MANTNLSLYIAPRWLKRMAQDARSTIIERTLGGDFLNADAPTEYSSNTLHVPRYAFSKENQNAGAFRTLEKAGAVGYYRMGKALWVAIEGGYRAVRSAKGQTTDHVTLSDTGQMLQGLNLIRSSKNEAVLGWRDPELAERAYYHNVSGASKSRVIREFLGLTDDELDQIIKRHIDKSVGIELGGRTITFD